MVSKKLELWSMVPTLVFGVISFGVALYNFFTFFFIAKDHNLEYLVDIDKCECEISKEELKIYQDLFQCRIIKMVSSFIQDASSVWLISLLIQEEADKYNIAIFVPVVAGVSVGGAVLVCVFRFKSLRKFIPKPLSAGLCVGSKGVYASAVILDTVKCLKYIQIPLSVILGCLAATVTLGFIVGVLYITKSTIGLWVGSSIEFTRNCATASTSLNIFGNYNTALGIKPVKNAGFYTALALGIFQLICICIVSVEKWKNRTIEINIEYQKQKRSAA